MNDFPPILVKKIFQKDRRVFTIEWSDGVVDDFCLSVLQKNCPCAGCQQESKQKLNSTSFEENLSATKISSVGRYALRIYFTSGCSKGIFSYDALRKLSKQNKA